MTILPDHEHLKTVSALSAVDSEIHALIDNGEYGRVEDRVMLRIEEAPDDCAFFIPVLRLLLKRKHAGRAELLLQLILGELRQRGHAEAEILFLAAVLKFWPECAPARDGLIAHLRKRYGASANFDRLAAHCRIADSPDGFEALTLFEAWLSLDEGTIVYLAKKGSGRVTDVNPALDTIRVTFERERGKQISFKFAVAQRMLEALPAGHFLRDRIERPEELRALAANDSGELLRRLFESVGKPLTVTGLREMLEGIVAADKWSSWWNRAKGDKRLSAGTGSRPEYSWCGSAEEAESVFIERFNRAGPHEQLTMAQKYTGRSAQLDRVIAAGLAQSAACVAVEEPSLALEFALVVDTLAIDRQSIGGTALDVFFRRDDVGALISGIKDRSLRRKAMARIAEVRQDWPQCYLALLREECDVQLLSILYAGLRKSSESVLLDKAVDTVIANPAESPRFYLWLCGEMLKRDELKIRAKWNFLESLISALGNVSIKEHHGLMRKQFDPGGSAYYAIGQLTVEQARQLLASLERGAGLEPYRREHIKTDLVSQFPQLRDTRDDVIYVSSEAFERKCAELEKIAMVDIPHNTDEMKRAKEHGDLSENFEYHAARARQEMLSSRAQTLENELNRTRALDPAVVDTSKINIGTQVLLKPVDADGEAQRITVLGPWDSDPSNNVYSYLAPAVAEILGTPPGERVRFNEREFVVGEITRWI